MLSKTVVSFPLGACFTNENALYSQNQQNFVNKLKEKNTFSVKMSRSQCYYDWHWLMALWSCFPSGMTWFRCCVAGFLIVIHVCSRVSVPRSTPGTSTEPGAVVNIIVTCILMSCLLLFIIIVGFCYWLLIKLQT